MKLCTRCGEAKAFEEFSKSSKSDDGRQWYCKVCASSYYRRRAPEIKVMVRERTQRVLAERKEWLIAYLRQHPCVDCGESDPVVLEFDHVRGRKRGGVAQMLLRAMSVMEVIEAEIAKCEVVCANCHRRRTYGRCGSYRLAGVA